MNAEQRLALLQRKPSRVTATFPHLVARWLFQQATEQGRSVSNLIAHLIELAMRRHLAEQAEERGQKR